MADIRIAQVDERDSNWELSSPTFRVYLHGSGPDSTEGFTDSYDITGCDVLQVIDWAQRQAGDSLTYAVSLVVDDEATEQRSPGHGRGLIWLVGTDGNADVRGYADEATTHQRMLNDGLTRSGSAKRTRCRPTCRTPTTTAPSHGPDGRPTSAGGT